MKSWFILLGICLSFCSVHADEVGLQSRLSRGRCTVGDEIVYTVEISWTGEAQRFKIERLVLPRLDAFEIVGSRTVNRVVVEDNTTRFQREIETTIRATTPGTQRIAATTLELVDDSNQTQALTTQALILEIEARPGSRPWIWGLGFLAALLGLVGLMKISRSRAEGEATREPRFSDLEARLDGLRHRPDHRSFYDGALEELRFGFSVFLKRDMPRERAAFLKTLDESRVRDGVRHLTDQLWEEIDNGRFNPGAPSGKDRERVIFQILDLLREIQPPEKPS